jgi:teichoic acid transport system permease protein
MARYATEERTSHTRLGRGWMILEPTLRASVYGLIFGVILGNSRPENFLPYLFAGVFFFTFMSGCLTAGSRSITGNRGLVASINFPRAVLPLQVVIRLFFDFLMTLPILLAALLIFQHELKWQIVFIPIVILLTVMFGLGVALIAARIQTQFADMDQIIPFINRILFYASGVFFSLDTILKDHPFWLDIVRFNPFYDFMEFARQCLVVGYDLDWRIVTVSIAWAVLSPVVGFVFFWAAEEKYGQN